MKTESFILKSKLEFKDRFYYANTIYTASKKSINITCKLHGDFQTTPNNHLGSLYGGCSLCRDLNSLNNFKNRITELFGNRFSFEKTVFTGSSSDLILTCQEHGDFVTTPSNIYKSTYGCSKCNLNLKKRYKFKSVREVLESLNKVHNNYYSYPNLKTLSRQVDIEILCPVHGLFKQKMEIHLIGANCNECVQSKNQLKRRRTLEEFIKISTEVHENLYSYEKAVYVNSITPLEITCKLHGSFWQRPDCHYNRKHGCPICKETFKRSSKEIELYNWVLTLDSSSKHSVRPVWLEGKELDIFIPKLNLAIEYNGNAFHHSSSNTFLGSGFKSKTYHDFKYNKCKDNGISLIHIFEFEDFQVWCDLILNYIKNPENYCITFKNNKRTNCDLEYYGQSFITNIYIDD